MEPVTGCHHREVYIIRSELGKGSFSTVYLGEERTTGQKVALKVIPKDKYSQSERAQEMLRNEVEVMTHLSRLHHPNLMRFFHHFEDHNGITLVLEYLSGGQLLDRVIQKGHYSEQDASHLCKVIVSTLAAMHASGVLHRDVKPDNCVYVTSDEKSTLKIADFGLSAFAPTADMTIKDMHLVGTPHYLSPEVLSTGIYSPASDMWGAGVTLFILLSGTPPFWGRTRDDIFDKIRRNRWGFRGRTWGPISAGAKNLVAQMLLADPTQRITAQGVLQHPWIKAHDRVPSLHLADSIEEMKRFNARQKFRAAALACIASHRLQRLLNRPHEDHDYLEGIMTGAYFTPIELERLRMEFVAASRGTSALSLEAFKEIMARLGKANLPLDRIFHMFDTDGNGRLDYKEFLVGLSRFKLRGDQAIKFCFDVLDEDQSGTISRAELTKVLCPHRPKKRPREAGPSHAKKRQETEDGAYYYGDMHTLSMDPETYQFVEGMAELFDGLDTNRDDQVSLQEFLAGVRQQPGLLDVFFNNNTAAAAAAATDTIVTTTSPTGFMSPPQPFTSTFAPPAAAPTPTEEFIQAVNQDTADLMGLLNSQSVGLAAPSPPCPQPAAASPATDDFVLQRTVEPSSIELMGMFLQGGDSDPLLSSLSSLSCCQDEPPPKVMSTATAELLQAIGSNDQLLGQLLDGDDGKDASSGVAAAAAALPPTFLSNQTPPAFGDRTATEQLLQDLGGSDSEQLREMLLSAAGGCGGGAAAENRKAGTLSALTPPLLLGPTPTEELFEGMLEEGQAQSFFDLII